MAQDIDSAFAELGLTPDATEPEVKAAWRRLVSRWHPDRNDSAAAHARMQRINRAVEAIRQTGFQRTPAPGRAAGGAPGRSHPSPGDGASARTPYDDDESATDEADLRASANGEAAEPPLRTIHRRVRLSLEEAAAGCTKVLRGRISAACPACEGAGFRVLAGHCPRCHGSGAVRERLWFAWMGVQTECDACNGDGVARQTCADCAGTGKAATRRFKFTVRLPHGVRDGDTLLVDGRRHRPDPLPIELSIRVEVLAHEFLELDPDGTVRCEMPVDGFAWIANRVVDVPTLDGVQPLRLDREQRCYRLKGMGYPVERRGQRGDQLVTVRPIFPQRMSADQQRLLDQLIATSSAPDAAQPDEQLRRWNQALRAWPGRRSDRS